ncbi:MAG: NAD-dependent epimerase/dehydratase family protein, partial [Lachnospiraceae bacterium]|nr:NAD-dependent epimerase/dehydratase family protein [Lachnospiraceae bacterium]
MKKVILFSPNGYVGGFIKERIRDEKNIQLYEMTRDSDWEQYKGDYDIMIYSAAITSARHETADKYVQDNVVAVVSVMNFCREHHVKRIIYISS